MDRDVPFKALIAGAGPAAIEAVLTLRELAPDVEIDLLAPDADFVYRPLSVVEPFAGTGAGRHPLSRLADLGVTVRQGTLQRVDRAQRIAVTGSGEELSYDALLVATGAQGRKSIERALTFGGPDEAEAMHGLIHDVEGGHLHSIVFLAPPGASWTLPIYELALQTAERAQEMSLDGVTVTVVSSERRPLDVFGEAAPELVETLFAEYGIRFVCDGEVPPADRLVTLPLPAGRPVEGLPCAAGGFLPVDHHCRVAGVDGAWAAGDGTDSTIKQGGLATQQGEAAARSIAVASGLDVEETPYEPVLRAVLIAGRRTFYLRRRLDGRDLGQASRRALWWPPTKIAGRRLAPFLDRIDAEQHAARFEPDVERPSRPVRRLVITPDATERLR
ncbi:MAG: FAD-dependent oxidoreductase [Solirubrobacteraceae bacterium]